MYGVEDVEGCDVAESVVENAKRVSVRRLCRFNPRRFDPLGNSVRISKSIAMHQTIAIAMGKLLGVGRSRPVPRPGRFEGPRAHVRRHAVHERRAPRRGGSGRAREDMQGGGDRPRRGEQRRGEEGRGGVDSKEVAQAPVGPFVSERIVLDEPVPRRYCVPPRQDGAEEPHGPLSILCRDSRLI